MDLKAKRKKKQSQPTVAATSQPVQTNPEDPILPKPESTAPLPQKQVEPSPTPKTVRETTSTLDESIQIQCNTLLYNTLQNMLASAHAAGDFTHTSVAEIIRTAMRAHQEGLPLSEMVEKGKKKQTTIRLDRDLFDHYKSWPSRLRTQILERVIRTYIKSLWQVVQTIQPLCIRLMTEIKGMT